MYWYHLLFIFIQHPRFVLCFSAVWDHTFAWNKYIARSPKFLTTSQMQEIRGAKPNHRPPTAQVHRCASDTSTLPFGKKKKEKKKRLIIYKESQSINEVSPISSGAGRVTFHYPTRRLVTTEGRAPRQLAPSSPAPTPGIPSSEPAAGPESACGFVAGRRGWLLRRRGVTWAGWQAVLRRQRCQRITDFHMYEWN